MAKYFVKHDYRITGKDYVETDGEDIPSVIYSTEEREVGKWVDESPIYEVTVYIETATTSYSNPYFSAALDIPIDKALKTDLVATNGTSRVSNQVYCWNDTVVTWARITNDNRIQLSTTNTSTETWTDIYVTIRYTKT